MASQWYQHHLGAAKVLLLTNDMDNRRKAREDGIVAETGTLISTIMCQLSHLFVLVGEIRAYLSFRSLGSAIFVLLHLFEHDSVLTRLR